MIILHDLNGRPYYEALDKIAKDSNSKLEYYESSVLKLFIRAIVKKDFKNIFLNAIKNILFRVKLPFIKNEKIIIGMAPYDFRLLWYRMLAKKNQIILHTSWPYWGTKKYPRKYGSIDNYLKNKWIKFLNLENVSIVAVSKPAYESIKKFSNKTNRLYQIPHVVNKKIFFPNKSTLDPNSKLKIVFVGKLIKEKGVDFLIKLINILPKDQFTFSIVGDGDMKKNITDINNENFHYYGWISDKKTLADIYRKNDILIVPSQKTEKWEELFGLVITEAMASGLTVLASNHIGPSGIITNNVNGFLLDAKNLTAWVEKLLELSLDQEKLKIMKLNAYKESDIYDIKKVSAIWNDIIKSEEK